MGSYAANYSYCDAVQLLFGWATQRFPVNVINGKAEMARTDVGNLVDVKRDGYDVHCDIRTDNSSDYWPPWDSLPLITRSSHNDTKSRAVLKDIYNNYLFLVDHCDRRSNMFAFVRCSDKKCNCSLTG